jgi:putative flavoprotein involved in K+ transport
MATGWSDQPHVPVFANRLDHRIKQLTPSSYRNPARLPSGGVLVVGASASGVQIADELARDGRDVVLAVGSHARLPRRYRGKDIFWWFDQAGMFAMTIDEVDDPRRARNEGSLQLIGRADGRDVDLPSLQRVGVRLAGRLVDADGTRVSFTDDVRARASAADRRMESLLTRIDDYIREQGLDGVVPSSNPIVRLADRPTPDSLNLGRTNISTIIWATGYSRQYPWLRVPVLDGDGEITQRRGVTPHAGLYVVGQRFQHRRDSNFIDGVRHDAAFIVDHIVHRLGRKSRRALARTERQRRALT